MPVTLRLAWRLLRSDWRSRELHTLLAALTLAIAAVGTVTLSTSRLEGAMLYQSSELLGGDLVLRSALPIDEHWQERAAELDIETAWLLMFSSVLMHGDELVLASVKGVSDAYPLRGALRVKSSGELADHEIHHGPPPGELWVDQRVLDSLGVQLGAVLELGASELPITRLVTHEPDSVAGFAFLAPRVLMNRADLAAAQVIAPGSRVHYRLLFAGDDLAQLRAELESALNERQELQDIANSDSAAFDAFRQGQQYIKITAILAVLLAAAAIAMSARRYGRRHLDTSALLRCFGMRHGQLVVINLWQTGLITVLAALLGGALGWLGHLAIFNAVADLLPPSVPPPDVGALWPGIATGVLLMGGIALPPLLRMSGVPPLRILRRDLEPAPLSNRVLYSLPPLLLGGLLAVLGVTAWRVLLILTALLVAIMVLAGLIYLLLRALKRLRRGPAVMSRLGTHAATNASQVVAIAAALLAMGIIAELRSDLLDRWRLQLPADAPNHFAMDIQPHQRASFTELLADQGITADLHPVARARIEAVNDIPLQEWLDSRTAPPEEADSNLTREHNLSWNNRLGPGNKLRRGEWPPRPDNHGLSIEAEFAARLGVGLNDRLAFVSGARRLDATVTSIREVTWESLSPNFFMVLAPGLLDDLPTTFLTSFRIPESRRGLAADIVRQFPGVNIISVEPILEQLQSVLEQVSLAVELLVVFVLAGGMAVLFAVIQTDSDRRLQEAAVMRAVGASRRYLLRRHLDEYIVLGAMAGLLAAAGVDIACRILYQQLFELRYESNFILWITLPLVAAGLVGVFGYLGTRPVVRVPPKAVLSRMSS